MLLLLLLLLLFRGVFEPFHSHHAHDKFIVNRSSLFPVVSSPPGTIATAASSATSGGVVQASSAAPSQTTLTSLPNDVTTNAVPASAGVTTTLASGVFQPGSVTISSGASSSATVAAATPAGTEGRTPVHGTTEPATTTACRDVLVCTNEHCQSPLLAGYCPQSCGACCEWVLRVG